MKYAILIAMLLIFPLVVLIAYWKVGFVENTLEGLVFFVAVFVVEISTFALYSKLLKT